MVGSLCGWVEIFFGEEVEFSFGTVVLYNDDSVALEVDGALDAGVRVGTFVL